MVVQVIWPKVSFLCLISVHVELVGVHLYYQFQFIGQPYIINLSLFPHVDCGTLSQTTSEVLTSAIALGRRLGPLCCGLGGSDGSRFLWSHLGAEVRLGEHITTADPDCVDGVCAPPVQDIVVDEYICHEDYDSKSYQNDICLLRLAKPIEFNHYVSPICLPVYDTFLKQSFESSVMEVAGWGITDIATGKASTVLLTLNVPIKTQFICELAYSGRSEIIDRQMCAGGVVGQDSCSGDSGGPLMAPFSMDAPPRYFIIGIVSFGPKKCANTNTPGVYTKVSEYMTWILDNIKE
ncbi:hypothetical protein J6590_013491 [Homalodisca vitripennis]|nr:hypothetical protein J6590_013491 [Homalodisca vitripennis]